MKQIIQDLKKGNTILEEIPIPQKKRNGTNKNYPYFGFAGNLAYAGNINLL